jgi:hypothetical protein
MYWTPDEHTLLNDDLFWVLSMVLPECYGMCNDIVGDKLAESQEAAIKESNQKVCVCV